MYLLRHTKLSRKSLKRVVNSGDKDILAEINYVLDILTSGKALDGKYRDHSLKGEYAGCRECHLRPNVLLIYHIQKEEKVLEVVDIGSHSELFD